VDGVRVQVWRSTPFLCSPRHLAWAAPRLSPALRAPPLCRCAAHTKRQGCEQGGEAVEEQGLYATEKQVLQWRWNTRQAGKSGSMVHSAQRHKGGAVGPRPTRRTAAELSAPSARSRTKTGQDKLRANTISEGIIRANVTKPADAAAPRISATAIAHERSGCPRAPR
jgi:hypothetical protein